MQRFVPRARLVGTEALVGVTGGPESVPRLLDAGLLASWEAVVTAADGAGADQRRWLVTDDLVRRERSFGRIRDGLGPALTATEPVREDRAAPDVLPPGTADRLTVARYDQLESVTASSSRGYADAAGRTDVALAPWSAVDGDPYTAWRSDAGGDPVGEWLQLELQVPVEPVGTTVRLSSSPLVGPRVSAVTVRTERGERTTAVLGNGSAERLDVPPGPTRLLELRVAAVEGDAGEVGVLELEVPGVRPARTLVTPADQPSAGAGSAGPSAVALHRTQPVRGPCLLAGFETRCDLGLARRGDEPATLDRTFTTRTTGTYALEGEVLTRPGIEAQALLEPLGGIRVSSSSSLGGDLAVAGSRAVDGNPATSWVADPFDPTPSLTLSWGEPRTVDRLHLIEARQPVSAAPREVTVEVAGVRTSAAVDESGWVTLPAVTADGMRLTIDRWRRVESTDRVTGVRTSLPTGIAEVEVPGLDDLVVSPDLDGPTGRPCGFGPAVELDGVMLRTEVVGTVRDLLEDRPLRWRVCEVPGVELPPGQHRVAVRGDAFFAADTVVLRSATDALSAPREDGVLMAADWGATRRVVSVRAQGPTLLVVPENANDGWVATADGERLKPLVVEGWQQAWRLPDDYAGLVVLEFAPQRPYVAGLLLGAVAALVLLALALRPGRPADPPAARSFDRAAPAAWSERTGTGRVASLVAAGIAALAGALLAGPVGALVLAVVVTAARAPRPWPAVARTVAVLAAAGGITAAALLDDGAARAVATLSVLPLVAVLVAGALARGSGGASAVSVRQAVQS